MCGIAGIVLKDGDGMPFLLNALDALNTRGYDGYGIATITGSVYKAGQMKLDELKENVKDVSTTCGIAHNRWATHGPATEENAHPHISSSINVIHNGDIDNFEELRKDLTKKGYLFYSETDTEVFAKLVDFYKITSKDFFVAVKSALLCLGPTSTYAFLIMDTKNPNQIIAARKGSRPLLWYANFGKTYISSEESALRGFVDNYQEIHEGEIALFGAGELLRIENIGGTPVKKPIIYAIDKDSLSTQKESDFWMYDEMMDVRRVIESAIGKRAKMERGIFLGGIEYPEITKALRGVKKFIIAGCGTSYHAAKIIAMAIEEIAGIEAEAIIASEAINRRIMFCPKTTVFIAISQSGETADLIRLMKEWKYTGILMLGIVNIPNTSIPKMTDAGIYCHIGREVAVASTKAFLGQIVCGYLFAIFMAQQIGIAPSDRDKYIIELLALPEKAEKVLKAENQIKLLALKYSKIENFLFMGRNYSSIVAMEGALKLKEITWNGERGIHATGISAGEMKHGTLAMVNKNFPSFVIAPNDSTFLATMNNVSEIQARGGNVILLTTEDAVVHEKDDMDIIRIPSTFEVFSPVLTVIPTQIFSFYSSTIRGCNPDMPLNLAKAVTVE